MGRIMPPLYGKEDIEKQMDNITKIDEKINALMIEREELVKKFKQSVKEENNPEIKD